MARFLFSVVPQLGHINPMLPSAVELAGRGHHVVVATGSDFRYSIESAGLEFFSAGPPGWHSRMSSLTNKMLRHKGMRGNYYGIKVLAEHAGETVGDLRNAVERFVPDAVVTDSITYAGAFVAEACGLLWATSCPIPGFIPTRDAPPFTTWGLPPSNSPLARFCYGIIRAGQDLFLRAFDADFNRVRASLNLAPSRRCVLYGPLSPYLILVFTCEGFEYKRSDWPAQAHLVGPASWGKSLTDEAAFDWIDTLPEDRPLIYATLGTVQIFRSLSYFTVVRDALKNEPYQVVMAVGRNIDTAALGSVPDNLRVEQFVPHARILPRAAAVIHHGGQGIAQDTIRHGLPSVVVPVTQDLYETASRCVAAGVSVRVPYRRLTADRLRAALTTALTDRTILENAQRLQAVYRNTDAGSAGATLLETLARTQARVIR